jgi:hypothetical protein
MKDYQYMIAIELSDYFYLKATGSHNFTSRDNKPPNFQLISTTVTTRIKAETLTVLPPVASNKKASYPTNCGTGIAT